VAALPSKRSLPFYGVPSRTAQGALVNRVKVAMKVVGVPKEIKADENRVALLPVGAELLRHDGHRVLVEAGAGLGSGISDAEYVAAGAELVPSAAELFERAELVVKVKEPQSSELAQLGPRHTVFGYFHFSGDPELTKKSLQARYTAVAYETLRGLDGSLPLLIPMSEVAGRLAVQQGAKYLEQPQGGRGVLLGGVPGVPPAEVLVIGGGVVGNHAARLAAGLGAHVTLLDVNLSTLRRLSETMPANVTLVFSDPHTLAEGLERADLVIGAVLLPGRKAPTLVRRHQLTRMKPGSVVVDVCIDQGGCFESSRPTTHSNPTFVENGVVHYAVTNMPGAVSKTSTRALCNATLPYVRALARLGTEAFCALSPGHQAALNLQAGQVMSPEIADALPRIPSAA
jgi:alanine dehydrogenase